MDEIGVQPLLAERKPFEQRVRTQWRERVPAHVRNLQAGIVRRDAVHLSGDPPESIRHLIFAPALGHQLHADADPEERPPLAPHCLLQRLDHAVECIEAAAAIGEGADPWQHDAVGAAHRFGIARHDDRLIVPAFVRRAFEGLGGRVQIARTIVDDGNAHRLTPGSGKRPMISLAPPEARGAAGGFATERWRERSALRASKKRRSASSTPSAMTMPASLQPRRLSVQPRRLAASRPTSRATMIPIAVSTPADAPRNRRTKESVTMTSR